MQNQTSLHNTDFVEICEAISKGEATDSQVCKITLECISLLLSSLSDCAEAAEKNDRQKKCELLDRSSFIKSLMYGSANELKAAYPKYAEALSVALRIHSYAEGVIVPAIYLSKNATDTNKTKTYVVQNSTSGLIKIGRSCRPEERIKSLETGAGQKLEVMAIIDGDHESELHSRFKELRVFGEWFRDDGSIKKFAETSKN